MRLTRTLSAVAAAALMSVGLWNGAAQAKAHTDNWGQISDTVLGYNVCADANSNGYSNNGDLIIEWGCLNNVRQEWEGFNYQGQDVWQIKNPSGKCLDLDSGTFPANGTIVQLWTCATGTVPPEQLFHLVEGTQAGNFHIEADGHWGDCLSFGPDFPTNGYQMILYSCDGTNQQDMDLSGFQS